MKRGRSSLISTVFIVILHFQRRNLKLRCTRRQLIERDSQGIRKPGGNGQRWLAFVGFELRQIALRDSGGGREAHLGLAERFAGAADLLA